MSTISRIIRRFSTTTITTATTTTTTKTPSISEDLYKEKNLKRVVEKFKKLSDSHLFRKQSNVYSNTVRRLASAKKLNYISDILEHQKQYDDISKEGFNVRLISLYGKSGMFDHAFKVFVEMDKDKIKKSVKAFNAVLGACVNAKKFQKVEDIFKEFFVGTGVVPDVVSWNTMIKAFVEMGRFEMACEVFGEIGKNGLEPDLISFNTLLIGLYGNGRFVDGERFWGEMVGSSVVPDIRSFNARLVGLVAEKKVNEAVEVFGELSSKNITPDVFSYNAVINGFCNDGDLKEAKKWFGKLMGSDFAPNKATYASLIRFACKMGDLDWAVELFKQTFGERCVVDPNVMQLVIDGLVKESKIEEAQELVAIGYSNKFRRYNLVMPADE